MNTDAQFYFDQHYHIYNKTNNKEKLFISDENRHFFLKKYAHYLGPFLHIYAYALMGNHFHFCVQIKSKNEIDAFLNQRPKSNQTIAIKKYLNSIDKASYIDKLITAQHHRFFISYVQAFNKVHNRFGNLLHKKFKRSIFDPNEKFKYMQYYIHHNARKHRFTNDFKAYKWTSYHEILNNDSKVVDVDFVINQFGNLSAFKNFHEETHFEDKFLGILIE